MQKGVVNKVSGKFTGAQFGAINCAQAMTGLQLGLINVADRLAGLQIGLLNFALGKEHLRVLPIVNASF